MTYRCKPAASPRAPSLTTTCEDRRVSKLHPNVGLQYIERLAKNFDVRRRHVLKSRHVEVRHEAVRCREQDQQPNDLETSMALKRSVARAPLIMTLFPFSVTPNKRTIGDFCCVPPSSGVYCLGAIATV
jgi:hypothetical protein